MERDVQGRDLIAEARGVALMAYAPEDATRLAPLGNDLSVARMMTSIRLPFTEEVAAKRMATAPWRGQPGFLAGLWAEGRLIGEAGIAPEPDHSVMYWLGARERGRGHGKAALSLLLELGFRDLGLERLAAECYLDNAVSLGLIERAGFVAEFEAVDDTHPERGAPARYRRYAMTRAAWEARR